MRRAQPSGGADGVEGADPAPRAPGVDADPVAAAPSPPPVAVAIQELLGFPVSLIPQLPLAATLLCRIADGPRGRAADQRLCFTTSRAAHVRAGTDHLPRFTGRELARIAVAVEHERLGAERFGELLDRKRREPDWQVTREIALQLDRAAGEFEPRGWTVGRVLGRLGIELVAVACGDDVPWRTDEQPREQPREAAP